VAATPYRKGAMLRSLHDKLRLRTSPTIFFGSFGLATVFIVLTLALPTQAADLFAGGSGWIITNLGWFYILGVTVFLIYLIFTAASRFGRIRLSPNDEPPEHSFLAWFAMLFAAGIGTILMFWGVAEPVNHFANPPMADVEPQSQEAAQQAISFTLYHFGLHTWTIFALPSLAFAYFIYQRNLPPRVSSLFHPLLGDKGIHGPVGKAIDILAIVGTLFGVAVSIALGTLQINAGLARVLGIEQSSLSIIIIVTVVSLAALVSVWLGLEKGIKVLSNGNIMAAIGLMVFVLIAGADPAPAARDDRGGRLLRAEPARTGLLERRVGRQRRLAAGLDHLLLGLDHHLEPVRGDLHRAHLPRADHPGVHHRRAAGAGELLDHLVRRLRLRQLRHHHQPRRWGPARRRGAQRR
jgi:hypothetical protein